jgi:hypothetical protein
MSLSVSFLQINARSLKTVTPNTNKPVQFKTLVNLHKPRVISVCESWLNENIEDETILSKEDYIIYRKDRENREGGGVLIGVSTKLMSHDLSKYLSKEQSFNEMVAVEIVGNKGRNKVRYGVVCVYRPPDVNNFIFADNLQTCLNNIWRAGINNLIVVGDFNFTDVNWSDGYPTSTRGLSFACCNIFHDYGLVQLNTLPSREENNNVLDLLLCNTPEIFGDIDAFWDLLDTDHRVLKYNASLELQISAEAERYSNDYKKTNFDTLRNSFRSATLLPLHGDVNLLCNHWTNMVKSIIAANVPRRKIKPANKTPWVDAEVKHQSNIKERIRRKYLRTGKVRYYHQYKELSKEVKNLVQGKFNQHVLNCARNINANPRSFWSLAKRKNKNSSFPQTMRWKDEIAETPHGKAELFNRFFCSVFTKTPPQHIAPHVEVTMDPHLGNITAEEDFVLKQLKKLDISKATGSDGIPSIILKQCAEELAPSLTRVINLSLRTGIVPNVWKKATVCPIHKKGSKSEVTNYRPISLLPIPSKIMERCVFESVYDKVNPRLHPLQHGFRKGLSTTTQLLLVYDEVGSVLDNRGQVDAVYLDFSKAFDSVSHTLLLEKLKSFGFHSTLLGWFASYLANRIQEAVVEGSTSEESSVISGVPQGSILGPLLFLLYINDMTEILDEKVKIALYADDAKLLCSIMNMGDCEAMQRTLDNLHRWSENWLLRFNVDKCCVMTFTRKLTPNKYPYHIGNAALEKVQSFKDLGVMVEDTLSWDRHIRGQTSKANRMLYFLIKTIGFGAPKEAKRILYLSLVRPHLEFASPAWAPLTDLNMGIIESIQRRATIFICGTKYLTYSQRLQDCAILPLSYRRELLDLNLAYKILCGDHGPDLCDKLQFNTRGDILGRENTIRTLKQIRGRTETYLHSYFSRISRTWNSLPVRLRQTELKSGSLAFKFGIQRYLHYKLIAEFDVNNHCTWVLKCRCPNCRR